ncbi:hypothetical protein [Streptomyces sp. 1331.2]|uniref:hypothetical protein n=1 Tax=Streptomyces sp. 1331.2 TaxID=1938835 RepID=UPI000BDAA228|nr:hypothetical protein [Streptomyces sp. 1331.2]SOB84218.1 hypothetical protein SAMN06272789_4463 [Streptomyces sp. 1331.2]
MNDPTPAMPGRRRRLPDYAATSPIHLLMLSMGLSADDPRDVLLAVAYRLAARLERRAAPWDAEGLGLVGASADARLTGGPCSVHLHARIGRYEDLGDGAL